MNEQEQKICSMVDEMISMLDFIQFAKVNFKQELELEKIHDKLSKLTGKIRELELKIKLGR